MSQKRSSLKAMISFIIVFCFYPLVKFSASFMMNAGLASSSLCSAAMAAGAVGLILAVLGSFSDSDTGRTVWGLVGGLLVWTGLVEVLVRYLGSSCGLQWGNMVLCSAGFCVAMGVLYYGTGHLRVNDSVGAFSAYIFYMWFFTILFRLVSTDGVFGANPVPAYVFAAVCLLFFIFLFIGQLNCKGWSDSFRESILTSVTFWAAVEVAVEYDMIHPLSQLWQGMLQ